MQRLLPYPRIGSWDQGGAEEKEAQTAVELVAGACVAARQRSVGPGGIGTTLPDATPKDLRYGFRLRMKCRLIWCRNGSAIRT